MNMTNAGTTATHVDYRTVVEVKLADGVGA